MLPQSQFEPTLPTPSQAPVAIAAITQDRALIGLLRSTVDPSHDVILVTSEAELTPHLNSRRVSACLLDSMFIEGDLAALAERMRETWPDLVLVVVGTAEEQSRVASQITSGVVYRFLHRPVSAPRVRLFVEAALRRHEVENVERTLEQSTPDFSRFETARSDTAARGKGHLVIGGIAGAVLVAVAGAWFAFSSRDGAPATADAAAAPDAAQVVSAPAAAPPASAGLPPVSTPPEPTPAPVQAPPPVVAARPAPPPAAEESVAERLRPAASAPAIREESIEPPPETPPPAPALTHKQRVDEQLARAEAALLRGELASPPGRSAVDLFRGALEIDPGNNLAKGGLVRVADRLLTAAERAVTAGNAEDAKKMVDVAETLTPGTARGAFLAMQIEMEHERAALARAKETSESEKLERGATYLRLANARLRSGQLIEPLQDNARFYLEAARQIVPDDPAVAEITRGLQRALLERGAEAAGAGNAAETERWLANADGAGAPRGEMANIRRALQDTQIGARASKVAALAQGFTSAMNGNRLLTPVDTSAKSALLQIMNIDAGNAVVVSGRQALGTAYLRELRAALARADVPGANAWLGEARIIGFSSPELDGTEKELAALALALEQKQKVVGANSLSRTEYVEPKFPAATRNRGVSGWVELEFTVFKDGSTGDIVVTNSNPRRTFDSAAVAAVRQWHYKPVLSEGKPIDQRAAIRIRFSDQ